MISTQMKQGWTHIYVESVFVVKAKKARTINKWMDRLNKMSDPVGWALRQQKRVREENARLSAMGQVQSLIKRAPHLTTRYHAARSGSMYLYIHQGRDHVLTVRVSDHPPTNPPANMMSIHPGGMTVAEVVGSESLIHP